MSLRDFGVRLPLGVHMFFVTEYAASGVEKALFFILNIKDYLLFMSILFQQFSLIS